MRVGHGVGVLQHGTHVLVGDAAGVAVRVFVGQGVFVLVGVTVGVRVRVGVDVLVLVGVGVLVLVGVGVNVRVGVFVGVGVGVAHTVEKSTLTMSPQPILPPAMLLPMLQTP